MKNPVLILRKHTQCQKEKTTVVGQQPNSNNGTKSSHEIRNRYPASKGSIMVALLHPIDWDVQG